jgi:hypothetical protein
LTKLGEEVWDETLLTKMKELINAKDYHVFYGELTKENIDLLGRKGSEILFNFFLYSLPKMLFLYIPSSKRKDLSTEFSYTVYPQNSALKNTLADFINRI